MLLRWLKPQIRRYSGLTKEQKESFDKNGFLHISSALSHEMCDRLRARAAAHLKAFDPNTKSIFSSKHQTRYSDAYFLSSGPRIHCFFEEDAVDEHGNITVPLPLAINKIGHNLHSLDPAFQVVSFSSHVKDILQSLGYVAPVIPQSMYIFKQPSIGGEVGAHQDGTYLYTEPQSVIGLWWALEDCTTSNGCLYGVAGSHKTTPVAQHFRRTKPFEGEEDFDNVDGPLLETVPAEKPEFDLSEGQPILTKKGDLVLLHSSFVHYSHANTSPHSRHAYAIHVVESHNTVYPKTNWLQFPKDTPFPRVY
ncbi:phytanoyl-CoA dioxygenase domain-containing protein [Thraustotheca clavata]|uniref:Phytanoyl-CoA dioxygenase domain-containing protein n=1 Tax=Thraustotheca clavata TaxID=74557 RepID=A0A1V9ZCC6_9STRA|nr:phytanoyl-CoA dioxygenase domain-containing protein [Thraustotheca clavata]